MNAVSHISSETRLFTGRFCLLAGFNFITFFSGFQLFPTMPLRILSLGGTESQAGLFLGFITFSSALSAPFGGAIADRLGHRRILMISSSAFFLLSFVFALARSLWVLLPMAVVFGIFWSALLAASFALLTGEIPPLRRAEGVGYAGIAGTLAVAISPSVGLAIFRIDWYWLCATIAVLSLVMLSIAAWIRERKEHHPAGRTLRGLFSHGFFEHRIFIASVSLLLYSFGYGGITSFVALYAKDCGTRPQGLFFMVFAATMTFSRPVAGRLADRRGRKKMLVPCLALIVAGQSLLALSGTFWIMALSACVFGLGFGAAFPIFASLVLDSVESHRRGAAYGSVLMAFDSGLGSGSMLCGVLIEHFGYRTAFAGSAALALLSIPYFLWTRRLLHDPRHG